MMQIEQFGPPPSGSPYWVGGTEKQHDGSPSIVGGTEKQYNGSPSIVGGTEKQHNGSPLVRGNLQEGDQKDKLREACQQFEAIFLLQLWRAMQRTVPQQRQTLNYAEMFDLTFAEYLARYGQFGIAETLYEQLKQHNGSPLARGHLQEGDQNHAKP